MKIRSLVAAASIGFMVLLVVVGIAAEAAEINVLSTNPMRSVLEDLGPSFERTAGHRLAITFATSGQAAKRLQGGEATDVAIYSQESIERFVKDGKALAGSVTAFARTSLSVAVRKGSPKPDISSVEAFKRMLLAAKSVTHSDPAVGAGSGIHLTKVFDRLGIASEMKSKTVLPKSGVGTGFMVANGEAEIGVTHTAELMRIAGIEIVGALPDDLQLFDVFAAAIMAGSRDVEASKAFINFLRTPEAAALIKAKGWDPGTSR